MKNFEDYRSTSVYDIKMNSGMQMNDWKHKMKTWNTIISFMTSTTTRRDYFWTFMSSEKPTNRVSRSRVSFGVHYIQDKRHVENYSDLENALMILSKSSSSQVSESSIESACLGKCFCELSWKLRNEIVMLENWKDVVLFIFYVLRIRKCISVYLIVFCRWLHTLIIC